MLVRIVLSALALGLAAPAVAEPATIFAKPRSVVVDYRDLDLTKPADRQALDDRLDRAARKVCGGEPVRMFREMKAYDACLDHARASYQGQVEIALSKANARRVAVLADKLGLLASF